MSNTLYLYPPPWRASFYINRNGEVVSTVIDKTGNTIGSHFPPHVAEHLVDMVNSKDDDNELKCS